MARALVPGSRLNEMVGSTRRFPAWQVLVWNPNQTTIAEVASGAVSVPPLDLSPFVESVSFTENIGYESGTDPQVTRIGINLRPNPNTGRELRRGHIEDGIIVRVLQGDRRIQKSDWLPVFTGVFRGRPGENPGDRHTRNEAFTASAFGREEAFLNLPVTSEKYPTEAALDANPDARIDLGDMAVAIAQKQMGLGQNEILFGNQGFDSAHIVNQIVQLPALEAIYQLLFPVGKKPKFDGLGRLTAVDADLDKPAARAYTDGDFLIRSIVGTPNDIEVNNRVVLKGLDSNKVKVGPETERMIVEHEFTIGYFDTGYDETIWYSPDHTLTIDYTRMRNKSKKVLGGVEGVFGDPEFTPDIAGRGAFKKGKLEVSTPYLAILRYLLTALWIALEVTATSLQYSGADAGNIEWLIAKTAANVMMMLVIGTMQYLGRFRVQIMGKPFEYVFRQLVSQAELMGLPAELYRTAEYRNDLLSDIETLDSRARDLLRRELVKDQTYTIQMIDDPFLEVDDIIEVAPEDGFNEGDRYYITSISKTMQRNAAATMTLTAWKIADGVIAETIDNLELAGGVV
jgi:hypothetical protein